MRVAVTGASGFCGAAVARGAVAAGHEVICVGRRPGPVGAQIYWDAAGDSPPDLAAADVVVHLAAAVGDPRNSAAEQARFHRVNVTGTAMVLAANPRRLVHVSSASVYRPGGGTVAEDHP